MCSKPARRAGRACLPRTLPEGFELRSPIRTVLTILGVAVLTLVARPVHAQLDEPMSPLQIAIACAPPPTFPGLHADLFRVIGSQDTVARTLFGNRDLLVLNAGTASGLQLGQQFFVRRQIDLKMRVGEPTTGVRTLGWVRIVALNESTAIATVEHACGGILEQDYLAPFATPVVPAGADRDDPSGEPDFTALARVLLGIDDRHSAGAGDLVLIDRSEVQGVVPGTRMALYRDVQSPGLPLASVGEAIAVSVGPTLALTRITGARDAVLSGDYVAIRR
jgi:hypothetical protein